MWYAPCTFVSQLNLTPAITFDHLFVLYLQIMVLFVGLISKEKTILSNFAISYYQWYQSSIQWSSYDQFSKWTPFINMPPLELHLLSSVSSSTWGELGASLSRNLVGSCINYFLMTHSFIAFLMKLSYFELMLNVKGIFQSLSNYMYCSAFLYKKVGACT